MDGLFFMVVKLCETTEPEREQECPTSDATRSEDAHRVLPFCSRSAPPRAKKFVRG